MQDRINVSSMIFSRILWGSVSSPNSSWRGPLPRMYSSGIISYWDMLSCSFDQWQHPPSSSLLVIPSGSYSSLNLSQILHCRCQTLRWRNHFHCLHHLIAHYSCCNICLWLSFKEEAYQFVSVLLITFHFLHFFWVINQTPVNKERNSFSVSGTCLSSCIRIHHPGASQWFRNLTRTMWPASWVTTSQGLPGNVTYALSHNIFASQRLSWNVTCI